MATTIKTVPALSATVTGGGDASATKQDAQTALLEALETLETAISGKLPAAGEFSVFVGGGEAATSAKQDTANAVLGGTTDTAVDGDATGSISAKLRGINKALAAQLLDPDNVWTASHLPNTNTKATCVKAAPGAGNRLVVTGITATLAAGSTAPSAVEVSISLIEDAAGTPVTRWSAVTSLQAVAGDKGGVAKAVYIPATAANKSMTLEFSAAGGTNTYESVTLEGYTVAE